MFVFLKRAGDRQIIGRMRADKFQRVQGNVFKNHLHLRQGFKRIQKLKFAFLHLPVEHGPRNGRHRQGRKVLGFHFIANLRGGKRMAS